MANESTKWLYRQLTDKGYNVGKDYTEFDNLMQTNADSRKWAYDTATKEGYNVGADFNEFEGLVAPSLRTDSVTDGRGGFAQPASAGSSAAPAESSLRSNTGQTGVGAMAGPTRADVLVPESSIAGPKRADMNGNAAPAVSIEKHAARRLAPSPYQTIMDGILPTEETIKARNEAIARRAADNFANGQTTDTDPLGMKLATRQQEVNQANAEAKAMGAPARRSLDLADRLSRGDEAQEYDRWEKATQQQQRDQLDEAEQALEAAWEERMKTIDQDIAQVKEAIKERQAVVDKERGPKALVADMGGTAHWDEELMNLNRRLDILRETKHRYERGKDSKDKNWLWNTWYGIADGSVELIKNPLGLKGAADSMAVYRVNEKAKRGEPLTEAEQQLLDAYGLKLQTEQYAQPLGAAYQIGGGVPAVVEMAAEFGLAPGAGMARSAWGAAANASMKQFDKALVRAMGKSIVEGMSISSTTQLGKNVKSALDRTMSAPVYNDKGELAGFEGESLIESLLKTGFQSTASNAVFLVHSPLAKSVYAKSAKQSGEKAAKSAASFAERHPKVAAGFDRIGRWIEGFNGGKSKVIPFNNPVDGFIKMKASEVAPILMGDGEWEDWVDPEQNAMLIGQLLTMEFTSGAYGSARAGINRMSAKSRMRKAYQTARDAFKDAKEPDEAIGAYMRRMLESSDGMLARELGNYRALALKNLSDKAVEAHPSLRSDTKQAVAQNAPDAPLTAMQADALIDLARATYGYLGVQSQRLGNDDVYRKSLDFYSRTNGKVWKDVRSDMNSLLHTAEYEALEKAYVDAASEQVTDAEGNPVPLERRRHEAAMEYRYAVEEATREFFGMESVDDIGEVQESVRRFINNRVGEWHDYDELLYRINTSKDMSREQKEAAKAFLFAERRMAGSEQLLADRMAEAKREQVRQIGERTHTDGFVHEVTLRDGRRVFVKSGTLVTRENAGADGRMVRYVDFDKSHSTIVVCEPETGRTEMIDPHDIAEVAALADAKAMLEGIAGETEKAFRDECTAQMNGSVELLPGSEYELLLDNGSFEKAAVVDVAPSLRPDTEQAEVAAGDKPAERMVVLEFSDGSRHSVPEKDVEANVRYAEYERYRQKRLTDGSEEQPEPAKKSESGESANNGDAAVDGDVAVPAPAASPAPVKDKVAAGDIIRIGGKDAHVADMRDDIVTVWTTDKLNEESYTDRDTPGYYTSLNRSELDSMADRDADGNIVGSRADREVVGGLEGEAVNSKAGHIDAPNMEHRLSESEIDVFGKPFVISKDNTVDFGNIDAQSGLAEAPIRLSLGENTVDADGNNRGYGLLHIEAGHGEQIRQAGYASVEEFVEMVARNYTVIREGNQIAGNQTYLLEVKDNRNNTLFIQLSRDGKYWNVNSAGIFRERYSRRKPVVSSVPAVGDSSNAEAIGVNHGQNMGATATSGNSPETYDGKVTNSASDKQEIGAESSPRAIDRLPRNTQGDPVWDAPEVDAPTTWVALNEETGSKDRASNMLVKQQQYIADEIDRLARKEPRYREPAAKGDINAMLRAESAARDKYQREHEAWETDMAELQRRAAHWRDVAEAERESERQEQARRQAEADELRRRAQESERREAEQREAERERSRIEHERRAEEDRQYFEDNRERIEAEQRRADEAEQQRMTERENLTENERLAWEAEKRGFDKKMREVAEEVRDSEAALDILRDTTPHSVDEVAAMLLSSNKVVWKSEFGSNGTRVVTGADAYSGLGESERRKLMGMWAGRDKGGISIDKLAEDKFKELCQEFGIPYDNAEARDALIDMIRTSATRGSITNYIAERRMEQARRQAELERQYEEAQIEQAEREDAAALRSHTRQPGGIDNESVELLGRALPDEEVPFHRGGTAEADREVYEVGVGLLKSAGVPVVEVSGAEARRVLENRNGDEQLMGSRTDRKMESISRHFEGRQLDANTQAVVDVFSGKRDNVAIEVERPEGMRRVVMRQGKEQNAGTKHSLFRHFETRSNYVTADDIAMIPEIIAKGNRIADGKRVAYEYVTEDGTRLKVTTEVQDNARERFTNLISNRKPQNSDYRQAQNGNTQLSAQTSESEVIAAKLDNNSHSDKENDRKFLRTPSGEVYGWTVGGKVYLNRDAMNPETPVHEYTHLWDRMVREQNSKLWERGKELLKQTELWREVENDPNYADLRGDEDAIASEVHSRLTGRDGARLLREMLDRAAQQGYVARAQATDLLGKIRRWMGDMFSALKVTLEKWSGKELKALTLEDFNKLTLRDLAKGVDPRKEGDSNGRVQLSAAMARNRVDFDSIREHAVAERGIVMPGLNEAEVRVVEVPRHDFVGDKPIAAARKWAKENIVGEHTLTDSNGTEVHYSINGRSIDKYLSGSAIEKSDNLGAHLSVLKKLPDVISESIEAEVHADYLKGSDGKRNPENGYNSNKLIHRFYGMVEIDSENYRVKTTIEESRTPGEKIKSHSFEVTNIELLPEDNSPMKVEPTASGYQGQLPHGTAKLLKGVEKSYDSGVKLLEASENSSENIAREPAVGRRSRKVAGVSLFDRRADEGVQGSLFDDMPTDAEPSRSLVERARYVAHTHDADKANGVIEGYAERYMEYADGMERRDRRMAELEQEIEQRRAAGEDTLEAETELEALRDEATLEDSSMDEHRAEAVAQLGEFYRRLGNTPEDADRMAIDRAKQTRAEVEIRRAQLASRRRLEEEIPSLRSDAEQALQTESRGNYLEDGPIEAVVTTAGGDRIGVTSMGALPKLKEGDFALVERRFIADGMFTFDGKQRIESVDDVAYIFRKLEDFAQEHSFVVMQRADGSFKVVHTGMGNAVSTIVDMGAVRAAYEAFGADKIWFVHNHPSGTLEFSRADESLIQRIQSAFEGDVSDVDAIIINTRSGKYITYNEREKGNTTDSSSESEVGVELFGGKKFADDYNADGLTRISGSSSIADYVAQLRLGDGVKSGYLILDNGNKVMANIVINGEPEPGELAREMVSATLRYGGKRVVRYSNGDNSGRLGGSELMELKNRVQRISMDEISLLDNVDMRGGLHDGGNYSSAFDNGLLHDSEAAYGSEAERAEKIRQLKPIEVQPNNMSRDELRNTFGNLQSVNKNGKNIRYLRNTFGKNYKEGGLFAQVVPRLDSILRDSVLAYSEADNLGGTRRPDGTMHKSHPNVISFDNYVGKAIINGKEYYVRQTVQNTRDNSTGVHSCFVSDVALYENTAQGGTDSTILRRPNQSQGGIVDAKLQQFFERASSRGSKSSENFVNDPGTPAASGGGAGPMSAKERVMAYMLELDQKAHERGEVRNAGMAALGKMSRRVEKAMRLQQQYDAALLADVTGIARSMMGAGLIDSRSRLEVSRTMAAMRSAVSDTDIKECARRLMNVAASSQLRILSDNFEKLVRIKARKKDAHGVSVAGSLDFAGQEMLEAFNEGRGMSSVEPLGDRINEIENRLETADGNTKEIMQARRLGFELAMRYKELASTMVDNILELKSQLEHHKGTWKECANEAERRDYREKKASLEENLRDEQMKAADALRELTDIMFDQTSEARERLMEFRRAQDEHRYAIYHNVNSDLEGRAMRLNQRKLTKFDHALNSFLGAKLLLKPLGTFEQMMREFGRNSINGEGYLFDRFVRGWQECRDKQFKQQQEIEASLDEQARTILGGNATRWSDIYRLSNKKAGTLSWSEGKYMEEHDVTEGQLVYIYMVNKMPDGRMKLRHMGIDEAKVNEIEARMNPKLKALADWMQQVKLPELREVFNDTHIRVFGSSMAEIEDYFPLHILKGSRLRNVVIDENGIEPSTPNTIVGAIRNRTKNACSLDILNCDAFSVMLDHVRTMTEWNNFAQYNKDLGTLLSYNGFTNKARNMRTAYGSGDKFLKNFEQHVMLAGGSHKPKTDDTNKSVMNLMKLGTASCIAFRVNTAIKQILSAPAFNSEARADDMAYCTLNSAGSVKWAMQTLPAFERRWKDRLAGNEILRDSDADWDWTNKNWFKTLQRIGITPNAAVDAYTCAIGARAVYRTKLRNYLKEGFDQATAHKKACSDAEIAFNLSQQSSENIYLSTMQNERNFLTSVFTVFRNSPMSYARQTYQSARELYNSLQPGGKERQLAFETKKLMREGLTQEQADYAAQKRYYRNLGRNVFKFFNYAALLPSLWAWGLSGMWYSIFGDDPKKKLQHATDALLRGCTFGWAEGFIGGGTLPDLFFDGFMKGEWHFNQDTMPAASMIADCFKLAGQGKKEQLIQQAVNTVVSAGIGVNPQVLEDVALAGVDFFSNEKDWRDYAIMAMRIIQAPQSQIDQVYLDKIGMSAAEAKAASPAELAERYAIYKMHRQNLAGLMITDAQRREALQKDYQGRFEKIVEGLHLQKSESEVLEALEKARAREAEFGEKSKRAREQSYVAMAEVEREKARDFGHQMWSAYKGGLNVISKEWLRALDGTTAAKAAEDLTRYRVLLALVLECGSAREAQRYTAELNALNSKYAAMKHKRLGRR